MTSAVFCDTIVRTTFCTAVDPVARVLSISNRMSADDVVVTSTAKDSVKALAADDDIVVRTAVDQIVAAKVAVLSGD